LAKQPVTLDGPFPQDSSIGHRVVDCGEDAYAMLRTSKFTLLAVADGVGGWADRGIDSSRFAWALVSALTAAFQHDLAQPSFQYNDADLPTGYPRDLLERVYSDILQQKGAALLGSATVCLGIVDHRLNRLHVANLGDSGFLVYRRNSNKSAKTASCAGRVLIRSTEQQHAFNFPFQLTPYLGRSLEADLPAAAQLYSADLQHGDLVFFASDGVFDNLYISDLCPFFDDAFTAHTSFSALTDINILATSNHRIRLSKLVSLSVQKGQNTT
jgi:protein phosphatase PTC7